MQNQSVVKDYLHKLGGYYLIPHERLHVLAYRIIGKPCHYDWGDHRVQSTATKTRSEELFVLLFPFAICIGLGLFFHALWIVLALSTHLPPELYFSAGPKWHLVAPAIATLFILYSGTGYGDVRYAIRLLSERDKSQQDRHPPRKQANQQQ